MRPCSCGKKVFRSIHSARQAHAKAHWRLRVYWCAEALGFHVTNGEKRSRRP